MAVGVSEEGLWRDILEARYDNWRNMGDTLGLRRSLCGGRIIGLLVV